jgi:hypothetical protein
MEGTEKNSVSLNLYIQIAKRKICIYYCNFRSFANLTVLTQNKKAK